MPGFKGAKDAHGQSRDKITEAASDGSDLTINEDTEVVFGDTTSSAQTITIPEGAEVDGKVVTVVDSGGNAGTNAISVSAASGSNVNGSDQDISLSTNYGDAVAYYDGDSGEWFVST